MPGPGLQVTQTLSLHQRILGDIEQNILSGRWPPGHKLPSEEQLAEQYGCSRMTVNKVLTQLARAGLMERRRKVGSVVTLQKAQSAILEIYDIREEVRSQGKRYSHKILRCTRRLPAKTERDMLGLTARQQIVDVTCVHFSGRTPFCLEERLINLAAVPEAATEDFKAMPPGPWLLDHVPWSAAEHRIASRGATDAVAAALGLSPGTPVLVVERQTWKLDQSVTHVRLTYPGESHTLMARFTPNQA